MDRETAMKKMKSSLLLGVLICLFTFIIYPFIKDYRNLKQRQQTSPVLTETEKEKIIIKKGKVTHVTKEGIKINPNSRETVVTINNDGTVDTYSPTWNFINELGVAALYSRNKLCVGLDSQVFYYKTWGAVAGVAISINRSKLLRFYIAGSKQLPFKQFNNTSIFIGVDHDTKIISGLRIEF